MTILVEKVPSLYYQAVKYEMTSKVERGQTNEVDPHSKRPRECCEVGAKRTGVVDIRRRRPSRRQTGLSDLVSESLDPVEKKGPSNKKDVSKRDMIGKLVRDARAAPFKFLSMSRETVPHPPT